MLDEIEPQQKLGWTQSGPPVALLAIWSAVDGLMEVEAGKASADGALGNGSVGGGALAWLSQEVGLWARWSQAVGDAGRRVGDGH